MLEKHALPDQVIIKCLNTNYGIAVATLTFLPIGADANASIYEAQTFDQASCFINLNWDTTTMMILGRDCFCQGYDWQSHV